MRARVAFARSMTSRSSSGGSRAADLELETAGLVELVAVETSSAGTTDR